MYYKHNNNGHTKETDSMKSKPTPSSIIVGSLLSATLLSAGLLMSVRSYADNDSAVDDVAITVPVSCTMSGNIATGQEHTATLQPGTYSGASGSAYENGIGKTTLTTFCNDYNGFSIYAIGFTGDTAGDNTLVGTSASGGATINTKAYESTDTTSNWSMKVTKVDDSTQAFNPNNMSITNSFNAWHSVPDDYTKVAEYHASIGSSTTDQSLGAKVETTYAAFVSTSQPADTYTGKVKYVMVHPYDHAAPEKPWSPQPQPSTSGYITYYANAPEGETVGTMGNQVFAENNVLFASNFSRNGYGFAGWSDVPDYETNQNAHFYGPNESFAASEELITTGLSLYAVWVQSEGSLQDSANTTTLCGTGEGSLTQAPIDGTANLSSVTALTDQRDGQVYAIAKLADGNCWMIENLRIENTATTELDDIALSQGYGGVFIGLAEPESTTFDGTHSSQTNSIYSIDGSTPVTVGDEYTFPRYNHDNTQNRADNTTNTNENTYSYGNYYTWAAAIANTDRDGSSETSICPRGWHIASGDSNGEYDTLNAQINGGSVSNDDGLRRFPANFVNSGGIGYFGASDYINRGSGGTYWSVTRNGSGTRILSFSNSYTNPGTDSFDYPFFGRSVRCMVTGL